MIIVIETLRHVREVLTEQNYKVNPEILRATFELSLKENHGQSTSNVLQSPL